MKILDAYIKWLQCKRGSKTYENLFKRIKLRKNNYANKSTDKELFFFERAYKSNNTFEKFPLEVKTHNIKEKRGSEIKREIQKNLIS